MEHHRSLFKFIVSLNISSFKYFSTFVRTTMTCCWKSRETRPSLIRSFSFRKLSEDSRTGTNDCWCLVCVARTLGEYAKNELHPVFTCICCLCCSIHLCKSHNGTNTPQKHHLVIIWWIPAALIAVKCAKYIPLNKNTYICALYWSSSSFIIGRIHIGVKYFNTSISVFCAEMCFKQNKKTWSSFPQIQLLKVEEISHVDPENMEGL